ncbi:MAG: FxDxF family PEP-CTERM protein [Burkholderiaceae bacterium]|nr:FxDxF family PEP-CTERM protein [Burkholderiaceae bacterium]
MNHKQIALAAAIGLTTSGAFADNINSVVAVVPNAAVPGAYSAAWGATHVEAGAFTDVFTFAGGADGWFSSSLITSGFLDSANIDFQTVSVNGNAYTLSPNAPVEWATLGLTHLNQPFTLTVTGIAAPALTAGASIAASYAGTADITPVPEPETAALMLGGLGLLGFLARRRKLS